MTKYEPAASISSRVTGEITTSFGLLMKVMVTLRIIVKSIMRSIAGDGPWMRISHRIQGVDCQECQSPGMLVSYEHIPVSDSGRRNEMHLTSAWLCSGAF
jgi:hypothetical protein